MLGLYATLHLLRAVTLVGLVLAVVGVLSGH